MDRTAISAESFAQTTPAMPHMSLLFQIMRSGSRFYKTKPEAVLQNEREQGKLLKRRLFLT